MIKKRHYVPVTSVIKCSLLPVNQAWETQDWGNPEILNRLIRQSQDICDLWTFTSTNNSIHKLASESQESTAFKTEHSGLKASSKYEQCYAQLTNDSGYDVSLQKTFLTSKQRVSESWQAYRKRLCRHFLSGWQKTCWRTTDCMTLPKQHPVYPNFLEFLLESSSAGVISVIKMPKLVRPTVHISCVSCYWVNGALTKSVCSKPGTCCSAEPPSRLHWHIG